MTEESKKDYSLSREDIAERFGVHPQTVRNLTIKGQLPHVKIGNQYRYCMEEVAAALRCVDDKL